MSRGARTVSLTTGPERLWLQPSHTSDGFIPASAGHSGRPLGVSKVSGAPRATRGTAARAARVARRAPGPRSRRARARARPRAGACACRGGGSRRPLQPGSRSEPLRTPGGRHPGALQLLPGARPLRRDSRARTRGRRRPLGPEPPRNLSARAAAAPGRRTDSPGSLADSQLAQGPACVPRHRRRRGELCAGCRPAGGRARGLGECGEAGRARGRARRGTRRIAPGCPLGSPWSPSTLAPRTWRRAEAGAGRLTCWKCVYPGERASHGPATPPGWGATRRPTLGSTRAATVPEARPKRLPSPRTRGV